jgi:hypothetical protein
MSQNQGRDNPPEGRIANVVVLLNGEAVSRRFRWAPGAELNPSPVQPPPAEVNSYADATLRIIWTIRLYAGAARLPPDTVERRRMLEEAHFALPVKELLRLARSRGDLACVAPIVQRLRECENAVGAYLGSLDSPTEAFPAIGGMSTRLLLELQESVNLLQPYVVDERGRADNYEDEKTRRVAWNPETEGFIPLSKAVVFLNDAATKRDLLSPTIQGVAKRLDTIGNPVRHMKKQVTGGGRGNRRVHVGDVERHADYLLGSAARD